MTSTITKPAEKTTRPPSTVDAAAQASIGAAARELHLPTVRTEATRLADLAVREHQSYDAGRRHRLRQPVAVDQDLYSQTGPSWWSTESPTDLARTAMDQSVARYCKAEVLVGEDTSAGSTPPRVRPDSVLDER